MKKILFACAMAIMATACNQKMTTATEQGTDVLPVSHIDVESLIDSIDLDMDISALPLCDLYVLRHAFDARRGLPFRDAYLRSIYLSTTWYDSLMWAFDDDSLNFDWHYDENSTLSWREQYYQSIRPAVLKHTDEEQAFIDRVKAREDELRGLNFKVPEGQRVNVGNVLNASQLLEGVDPALTSLLARNGFAIVPAQHLQLFHVYEANDYHVFPSFVTTDLYLQLYHLYFDALLREVEEHRFYPLLGHFCDEAQKAFPIRQFEDEMFDTLAATKWINTYFNVAKALLIEQAPKQDPVAQAEYERVMKSENSLSEFLGYTEVPFEYSLFRPRGHYTRSDNLKRYFRTMMWLQTVPFRTDSPFDMFKASLLAQEVYDNKKLNALYKRLTEPMTWLMGQPDDVSIMQMGRMMADGETDDIDPNELGKKIDEIAEKQTRIRPKFLRTGRNKVRLMPQRYQPDAEVLQEMVDYESTPTKRATPRGLDVFAAMGNTVAERILIDELQEPKRWDKYKPNLERMKRLMDSIDWQQTVATRWIDALTTVAAPADSAAPYFMLAPEWGLKGLNAALASWTELKHDAILYAKQPMGAECGGAGPPDPVVQAYVEPNVRFWQKAQELLTQTNTVLQSYGLLTDRAKSISEQMADQLAFLLQASKDELAGRSLSEEQCDQLKHIGATFENLSLDMLRDKDHELWEWDDVQGPERSVALVADVYTANADNNPQQSILYEGVGPADEIYVVIEVQGYLWLMRGAVFSYREFTRPYGEQRMNDEEWQKRLESDPRQGVPEWMKPVIAPVKLAPIDNEKVFYSSGC